MGKVLVSGACGYIGSHTVIDLLEKDFPVLAVDNFSNSFPQVYDQIKTITGKDFECVNLDLRDAAATQKLIKEHADLDSIIHFAALKSVEESVEKPLLYFDNNIRSLINLLSSIHRSEIKRFVFSSSCTVYGDAKQLPVTEQAAFGDATSPYGRTKQICEFIIEDTAPSTSGTDFINLRYFNPAGAHPSGLLGESAKTVTRSLVPVIMEVASGRQEELVVNGVDYPTRDGSCIRDYIHISDLSAAHTKALQYRTGQRLEKQVEVFNLGIGEGVSVLEAIAAFEDTTNLKLNYRTGPRRPGDVIVIYADYSKAEHLLGWSPEFNIRDIMTSAWKWEQYRKGLEW
jgi:UDP-glucose 4-epimerase